MFANTMMGGVNISFPDVCLTPMPVPTPIPYPNISFGPVSVACVYNVLWGCTPAHNLATVVVISVGDNPGVALGVASGSVMGPTRCVTAAFTVLVGGMPATRMTSVTMQNSTNAIGMTLVPAQLKVLLLAP